MIPDKRLSLSVVAKRERATINGNTYKENTIATNNNEARMRVLRVRMCASTRAIERCAYRDDGN